jgi:hypothetical protein
MRMQWRVGAHRFQSFSRGILTVVSIAGTERHRQASHNAVLPVRCRIFGPGREDWNRGFHEFRRTILREGRVSRLADGAIRLHGLLGVDLCLGPADVERIGKEGLQITSPDLEIEIDADAFARALASLPRSGTVLPFPRRVG